MTEKIQAWITRAQEWVLIDRLTGQIIDRQPEPFDSVGVVLAKP